MRARIVYIAAVADKEWVAGCVFDYPLSTEARRAFLGSW
jgi:hypothetical protein